jgi:pyruvate formate lyase activating enzyme
METSGIVFHIQRFSIHDGPGIRTTVFLKGCSLRCFWCHNPEGRRPRPEIRYNAERCLTCGACVDACPNHAHVITGGIHTFDREACRTEGECVEVCFSGALELNGRPMTAEEVAREVLRDKAFYANSGGGVTLSGGEPSLSGEFSRRILELCKAQSIHTAIETCGDSPWEVFESLLPVTDLFMMDLKLLPSARHQEVTGRPNARILENARRLARTGVPMIFRTPVVPSVNDTDEEIGAIAAFIRSMADERSSNGHARGASLSYELLPFHALATDKYRSLGLESPSAGMIPPPTVTMERLLAVAQRHGITVRLP